MFGATIARRLRDMRKGQQMRQNVVADALELSVSAVSRLERGIRGLRVEQLVKWAGSLGYRVEIVFWEPLDENDAYDPIAPDLQELDAECRMVLAEVASSLPHMPEPARRALAHEMQLWREAARTPPTLQRRD